MSEKEENPSVGNPRDTQGVIALTVVAGFLGITAFALTKAGSINDVLKERRVELRRGRL